MDSVYIVMPAYNEEENILAVVKQTSMPFADQHHHK